MDCLFKAALFLEQNEFEPEVLFDEDETFELEFLKAILFLFSILN
jgi:hypothetical protein